MSIRARLSRRTPRSPTSWTSRACAWSPTSSRRISRNSRPATPLASGRCVPGRDVHRAYRPRVASARPGDTDGTNRDRDRESDIPAQARHVRARRHHHADRRRRRWCSRRAPWSTLAAVVACSSFRTTRPSSGRCRSVQSRACSSRSSAGSPRETKSSRPALVRCATAIASRSQAPHRVAADDEVARPAGHLLRTGARAAQAAARQVRGVEKPPARHPRPLTGHAPEAGATLAREGTSGGRRGDGSSPSGSREGREGRRGTNGTSQPSGGISQ